MKTTTILNREFKHPSDGWYHIEAKGEHPNHASGVVQIIDDEACNAIVNRFNTDAEAGKLSHGHEMLIDHEHFKHDTDKETRAYGWLQQLQNRTDGIYGRIRWSRTGQEAVDGGDYRFFSTEYDPGDLKVLNSARTRVRPMKLDGLTLTNDNNNKGQKPITNREESHQAIPPGDNQRNKMKLVLTELGLSADASEESALTAVRTLKNRVTTAEEKNGRVTELETQNATLLGEQVDGLLSEYKVTDTKVINRLKPILLPLKNRGERIACLADLGFDGSGNETETETETEIDPKKKKGNGRMLNRGAGDGGRPQPTGEEQAETNKATKIMNRARALMKETPNLSLATAVKMAQGEDAGA